jgi:creatinine amidohydrolase/Fe(II)-dependent formamide hydrolase-like protein
VPCGAVEQHGPHLPLDVDLVCPVGIAAGAGREIPDKMLVLPVVAYGYTGHVMDFPGTINNDFEHFMHQVLDITKSLAYHGFKKIILLNGHGSNMPNLDLVARRTNLETDAECVLVAWWNLLTVDKEFLPRWRQSKFPGGCSHACELETSLYLYLDGDNVRKDQIKSGIISLQRGEQPVQLGRPVRRRPGDGDLVDEQLRAAVQSSACASRFLCATYRRWRPASASRSAPGRAPQLLADALLGRGHIERHPRGLHQQPQLGVVLQAQLGEVLDAGVGNRQVGGHGEDIDLAALQGRLGLVLLRLQVPMLNHARAADPLRPRQPMVFNPGGLHKLAPLGAARTCGSCARCKTPALPQAALAALEPRVEPRRTRRPPGTKRRKSTCDIGGQIAISCSNLG